LPVRRRNASETTSAAAAPSVIWEEFPAVTLPSALNAGLSFASPSMVVSRRTPSSASTSSSATTGRPFTSAQRSAWTGMISARKRPASVAAAARRWLSAANASWSWRETR
jgi:hypothetical protein